MQKYLKRLLSAILCGTLLVSLAMPAQASEESTAQMSSEQQPSIPSEEDVSGSANTGTQPSEQTEAPEDSPEYDSRFLPILRTDADQGGKIRVDFDPGDAPSEILTENDLVGIAVLSMSPLESYDAVKEAMREIFGTTGKMDTMTNEEAGVYLLPILWDEAQETYVYGFSGQTAAGEGITFSLPQYFIWTSHRWVQQYLCVFPAPNSQWKIAGYGDRLCVPMTVQENEAGGNDIMFSTSEGDTDELSFQFVYGQDVLPTEPPTEEPEDPGLDAPGIAPIADTDFNFTAAWESCGQATTGNWKTDSVWDTGTGYSNSNLFLRFEITFNANKNYAAGQVKLYFPYYLFTYRNSNNGPELSASDKVALQNLQGWSLTAASDGGDRCWVLTNTSAIDTGKQITIPVEYAVQPMETVDGAVAKGKFQFVVKVQAGNDTASQTLSGAVKTGIKSIEITKTPENYYSRELKDSYAGQVMAWVDYLSRYGVTQGEFEADLDSYFYMEYTLTVNFSGNQPAKLSIKDTPGQGGIVIGTTYHGMDFSSTDLAEKYGVLVKFPKSSAGSGYLTNSVQITATGIDGDPADVKTNSATANHSWVAAKTDYDGEIFFLGKTAAMGMANGFGQLRAGNNVKFRYAIIGGANSFAFRSPYGSHPEYLPLKIELVDDALFLSGYDSSGSVTELGSGDYIFTSIDIALDDRKNVVVGPDGALQDRGEMKTGAELGQISIYVMDSTHSAWTLYKTVTVPGSDLTPDEYNNVKPGYVTVSLTDQAGFNGVYRVKVVYDKSTDYTEMRLTLTGNLLANSSKVRSCVTTAQRYGLNNMSLHNWAGNRAYDHTGTLWLDGVSPNGITTSPATLKNSLLALDRRLYTDTTASVVTFRSTASNLMGIVNTTVGAYLGGNYDGTKTPKYDTDTEVTADIYDTIMSLRMRAAAIEFVNTGRIPSSGDSTAYNQMWRDYMYNSPELAQARGIIVYLLIPSSHTYLSGNAASRIDDAVEGTVQHNDSIPWKHFSSGAGNTWTTIFSPSVDSRLGVTQGLVRINGEKSDVSYADSDLVDYFDRDELFTVVDHNYKNSGYQLLKLEYPFARKGEDYFYHGIDVYTAGLLWQTANGNLYQDRRMVGPGYCGMISTFIDMDILFLKPTFSYYLAAQFTDEDGNIIDYGPIASAQADNGAYNELKVNGQYLLSDLDGDGDTTAHSVVFGYATFNFTITGLTVTDIKKSVKADADGIYGSYDSTAKVKLDDTYTYRLFYSCSEGKSEDLILLDTIEEAYGNNPHWKGTLTGVDLSEARDLGVTNIAVWVNKTHAYTDAELITNTQSGKVGFQPSDLTGANGWEKIDPNTFQDWASVKTIAFDFRGTTFSTDSLRGVMVYLHMQAPADPASSPDVKAYNRVNYFSAHTPRNGSVTRSTNMGNVVTVTLDADGYVPKTAFMAISKDTSIPEVRQSAAGETFSFEVSVQESDGTAWAPEGGNVTYYTVNYPGDFSNRGAPQTAKVVNGKFTVSLTLGKTALIEGVPVGASYTVTEMTKKGWACTSKAWDFGTIEMPELYQDSPATENWAIFINDPDATYLVVEKQMLDGVLDPKDPNKEYTFTILLTDIDGSKHSDAVHYDIKNVSDYRQPDGSLDLSSFLEDDHVCQYMATPQNGVITVKLQAGQFFVSNDLSAGTQFTVTESGGLGGRYSLYAISGQNAEDFSTSGTSASGTLSSDGGEVRFINKFIPPLEAVLPETGGPGIAWLTALGAFLIVGSVALVALLNRKRY